MVVEVGQGDQAVRGVVLVAENLQENLDHLDSVDVRLILHHLLLLPILLPAAQTKVLVATVQKRRAGQSAWPESCFEAKAIGQAEEGRHSKHLQLDHILLLEFEDWHQLPMMKTHIVAMRNAGCWLVVAKTEQNSEAKVRANEESVQ